MTKIPQLTQQLQYVLGEVADQAGRQSGLIQRHRKLSGSTFVRTMVLGRLSQPQASLEALSQTACALGVPISAQGLAHRLDERGADCLRLVLEKAMALTLAGNPVETPLLARFNGVYLQDSSVISLPEELVGVWPGCGGSLGESAALKIQVELSLSHGQLGGPFLQAGKAQDRSSPLQSAALPRGSLLLRDLGYWSLAEMHKRSQRGEYWLLRVRAGTKLSLEGGPPGDLVDLLQRQSSHRIDLAVHLGGTAQTPARLLAVRVPEEVAAKRKRQLREKARSKGQPLNQANLKLAEWNLLVTNVPKEQLSMCEAFALARARWQIELRFKLWKQSGQVDKWQHKKPFCILCECYAKLLAMLIQHWFMLTAIWQFPNRSLTKAAQTVRRFALGLTAVWQAPTELERMVGLICQCMSAGCKMNPRASAPNSYQLLLHPDLLNWEGLS